LGKFSILFIDIEKNQNFWENFPDPKAADPTQPNSSKKNDPNQHGSNFFDPDP